MASKANIDVKSNALSRTTKACLQCRSMKSKCDGHSPCGRCLRRNTDCKYEEILYVIANFACFKFILAKLC